MTSLEILDRLVLGQTVFHRCDDSWDLLDETGLVSAVLCPRTRHVSIAPVATRVAPAPMGRLIPYGERVTLKISADNLEEGINAIRDLAVSESSSATV